ncbi:MAG: L-threonylcarbamoyladenylate synthase [Candidatus Omnitrophota bacterium]
MKPKIIKIDPTNINIDLLKQASEVIHNRGLVAFPTETVYGLGANALDPKAVTGIFEAKQRPLDDPLIVHIAEMEDLYKLAENVPAELEKLVNRFWPGPLTVVLKKKDIVPDLVTTGLETVAVRMPSNAIARKFIDVAGVPIAAPSANIFGRPSPTNAQHVVDDLEGKIDIVLDGGKTEIGIESTVVEVVDGKVIVLRPGGISIEELREIIPDIDLSLTSGHPERCPGKYPQHYSPRARVILIEDSPGQLDKVLEIISQSKGQARKLGIMAKQEHVDSYRGYNVKVIGSGNDGRTCAARLFEILREFDSEEVDLVIAEGISENGLGLAVMNRLRKAAGPDLWTL